MLKKLLDHFSSVDSLPVEITDVTGALINLGCQDSFVISPEDTDPGKIRGVYFQYTESPGVYTPPDLVTLIVCSANLDIKWQRVVCCKELIHVCDSQIERTDTENEVEGLLEKLLGPLSSEDYGLADLMASADRLALYKAICILFPLAARHDAKRAIEAGQKTAADIEEWAFIPRNFVDLVLDDDWPEIAAELSDC